MTPFEITVIGLTVLSVLLIPAAVFLVRAAMKWTRAEDKLSEMVEDMKELVLDKEKVHHEMLEQMRADREATDSRLRYLEGIYMDIGRKLIHASVERSDAR